MVTPFILKYRAELKLAEADVLQSTVAQIQNLEQIKSQIVESTLSWSNIQGECARTVATAKEVADGMAMEAKNFTEFMQKANDSEKATLRLEVDKLRRMEGEWLQVQVRTLDHVYALYLAGQQSGQPHLAQQLAQFQHACRDAARRMGLVAFGPEVGDVFDPQLHQVADGATSAGPDARIGQVVATGFTYQGQFLRPAVVVLAAPASPEPVEAVATPAAAPVEMVDTPAPEPAASPEDSEVPASPRAKTKKRPDPSLQPDLPI
jgi:molecular chaperone GrpE (heat shock protein)